MRRVPRVYVPAEAWPDAAEPGPSGSGGAAAGAGPSSSPAGVASAAPQGARVALPEEARRHLERVLRLGPGAAVALFDGAGREATGVLRGDDRRRLHVEIETVRRAPRPPGPELVLIVGLLKADKMDWVVQKSTELGVDQVAPVETARSVARTRGERRARRRDRLTRIAQEAARQSGRSFVPAVAAARPLGEALAEIDPQDSGVVLWEGVAPAEGPGLRAGIAAWDADLRRGYLLVGPEGGLTAEEVSLAAARGLRPVTLGSAILRAETAAIAAVALVNAQLGRLG